MASSFADRIAKLSPERLALLRRELDRACDAEPASAPQQVEAAGSELEFDGLSFAEERLWLIDRFQPGLPTYNLPFSLALDTPVDRVAVASALAAIMARHEVLRCVFAERGGRPYRLLRPVPARRELVPCLDLRELPAPECQAEVDRLFRIETFSPFDLGRGPLLRTLLLDAGEEGALLIVVVHHIVFDGWSQSVFSGEFLSLYAAARAGTVSPLPAPALSYSAYSRWQRMMMDPDWLRHEVAFWSAELADVPARFELPSDRMADVAAGGRGAAQSMPLLEPGSSERFRALAHCHHATPFMVHLAAFQVLLYRTTGQAELVVGTPVANRDRPETEGLIGLFVNTVLLRARAEGRQPFQAFLDQVRERTLDAFSHARVPFEQVVAAALPQRSLGREHAFRVMFALQPAAGQPRVQVPSPASRTWAKIDLTLTVLDHSAADVMGRVEKPAGKGYSAGWEFSTEVFDPTTIQRLGGQLVCLLDAVLRRPETPLDAVPLLAAAQRHQLLVEWQGLPLRQSSVPSLHGLFAQTAARSPQRTALEWQGGRADYATLAAAAARLAQRLRAAGLGLEDRVVLWLPRSPTQIVAILAVLSVGAAYVPLDPDGPSERNRSILADARPQLVLCAEGQGETCRRLGATAIQELPADVLPESGPAPTTSSQDARSQGATSRRAMEVPLEGAAYVIYTSGSSGRPKGVVVPHRAASRHMLWMVGEGCVEASDRVLHKTPASFDASVWELFATWAIGAVVVLAPAAAEADPQLLAETLERSRCTVLQGVPSLLASWLETLPDSSTSSSPSSAPLEPPPTALRRLFSGGETLTSALARGLAERLPGVELINLYGPTEAAIDTTFERLSGVDAGVTDAGFAGLTVAIGRPLAGTSAAVLDASLRPVAAAVAGELTIVGDNLARGYLGAAALTAAAFVPCPWGRAGARMYRTGDRVRRLADGRLEFLGRIDRQLKVRGFRLEPAEVEQALAAEPTVHEAAVVAAADPGGGCRLIAYVVAAAGGGLVVENLRVGLERRLPAPMVPSLFLLLDALPRLPNGKLDRLSLPQPGAARPELSPAFRAPVSRLERQIAAIWQEVLGVDRVGVDDSFFALGGHSLAISRVLARIRDRLDLELPMRTLFEVPTVAALAAHVEGLTAKGGRKRPALNSQDRQALEARVDDLSDEEVERLLGELGWSEDRDPEESK